jgi:hypothetical protein
MHTKVPGNTNKIQTKVPTKIKTTIPTTKNFQNSQNSLHAPFFALPSSHSLLRTPIFTLTLPTKHRGQINGAGPTAARASLCFGLGLAAKDVQQLERGQQGLGVGLATPFLKISKIEKNVSIDHTRNCIQT